MSDERPPELGDGAVSRLFRAGEVLASAHAARAKDEARRDVARVVTALALFALAGLFLLPACLLAHVALVSVARERYGLSLPAASSLVAAVDVVVAALLAWVARSQIASPVMVETRATLKRAVAVWRG